MNTNNNEKVYGFKVRDYFVAFPPGDFITEGPDGQMSVAVDIFKISKDNRRIAVDNSEITEELEIEIAAHINEYLTQAIRKVENE